MEKIFHRRNLPHLYFKDGQYFVTYRLANTIPRGKLKLLHQSTNEVDFCEFSRLFKQYDNLLHSKDFGNPFLKNPQIANICMETLVYPDDKDYLLICFCILKYCSRSLAKY